MSTNHLRSVYVAEDDALFALIFEDVLRLADLADNPRVLLTADEAEDAFKKAEIKPDLMLVDVNLIGSTFNGLELVRRINFEHGNGIVIGIVSSSDDPEEQAKAVKAGAQFWIVKSEFIEESIDALKRDLPRYQDRTAPFNVYR